MSQNEPTVLWIKYMFNGQLVEDNTADGDIEEILYAGPGMALVKRLGNVVDQVVSDQMVCRLKHDKPKVELFNKSDMPS